MIQKYFPLDKNYILETAQLIQEDVRLYSLSESVKKVYLQRHNPLGIMDDTAMKIQSHQLEGLENLQVFYNTLSGIYRYKNGSNQLELVFDGRDHLEVYKQEWKEAYELWVSELCQSTYFIKTILELTVFYQFGNQTTLAHTRLNGYIEKKFGLKVYKHKGIVPLKIA